MKTKDNIDDAVVIQPTGRLDSISSPEFERILLAKITDQSRLIVDFSKLDYISSAGLRVILVGAKRIDSVNGKILLCGMKEVIKEIFEVSGFLKILKVEKNLSKAKQAIKL
ncbi:MAG: STAS domain-containing protein [bacterium]|nr:STAS domain-containing protein [bacterium]